MPFSSHSIYLFFKNILKFSLFTVVFLIINYEDFGLKKNEQQQQQQKLIINVASIYFSLLNLNIIHKYSTVNERRRRRRKK